MFIESQKWKLVLISSRMNEILDFVTEAIIVYVIKHAITGKFFDFLS